MTEDQVKKALNLLAELYEKQTGTKLVEIRKD